ncbi:MAG: hypothetical protein ACYCVW_17105 [Rhodocyclaceae bacterium]
MRPYAVTIPAGSVEEFAVVGDYIRLKTASVPVQFVVEETGESIELEQGDAANLSKFRRVKVLHADAAQQAIVFYVGNGTSADSSKVGGSIGISSMPAVAVAMTQTANAVGVASAQLVAANAARRFLLIQNTDAAANVFLNVAGAAAVLDQGIKLPPGASVLFDVATPSGAVFAIASAATAAGAVVVVEG